MTDNEIIKALECHCRPISCDGCPMHNREHDNCVTELWALCRDLINRQKDEIEGLIVAQETLQKYVAKLNKELERANAQFEKARALNSELIQTIADVHIEAIKEFAEKLKMANTSKLTWFNEDFDNLVKEMVGD